MTMMIMIIVTNHHHCHSVIKPGDSLHPCITSSYLPLPTCLSQVKEDEDEDTKEKILLTYSAMSWYKSLMPGVGVWLMYTTHWYSPAAGPINGRKMSMCEFLVQFGFVAHAHTLGRQFAVVDAKHMGANPIDLGECDQFQPLYYPAPNPPHLTHFPFTPPGDRGSAPWKIDSISTLWSRVSK